MKIIKYILCCCCVFLNLSISNAHDRVINFGTTNDYPPFEYTNPEGNLTGFDIEIANLICDTLKVKCKFTVMPFDSLITSLKLHKIDAIIAGMDYSAERAKEVSFSKPYYKKRIGFVALESEKNKISNGKIDGRTVGVQTGTVHASYLKEHYGDKIKIKYYDNAGELFMDLDSSRIDVVISDLPVINEMIKNKNKKFVYQVYVIDNFNSDNKGGNYIAISNDDTETINSINNAIDKINSDGTIKKISSKYF